MQLAHNTFKAQLASGNNQMELQHIAFKIFVDGDLSVAWEEFINVFHGWVASQSMPEMMIDVADYRHVPNGPGVVMTGREADYYMDNTAGKPGLRYVCKVKQDGSNDDRIKQAYAAASAACARMESEVEGLKFSRTKFELTINDRAFAPNNAATQSFLSESLATSLEAALGSAAQIQLQQDERKLAGAVIEVSAPVQFAAA